MNIRTTIVSIIAVFVARTLLVAQVQAESAKGIKDHVLFVGSEFTVPKDGKYYPVVGAGDRTFIVKFDRKSSEIPLHDLKDIRITRGLKLTNLSAKIDDLSATLSSDAASAEVSEAMQTSMALSEVASMQRDRGLGEMVRADMDRGAYSSESKITGVATSIQYADQAIQNSFKDYANNLELFNQQNQFAEQMILQAGSSVANAGDGIELVPEITADRVVLNLTGTIPSAPKTPDAPKTLTRRVRDLGAGQSDRLDLEFNVSTAEPLDNAYVVVVTEYTAPKTGTEVFRRVLSQRVGRIDAKPRKVHLYQTFFPSGFHLRTYTIDLYANGQEVATNASETKMTMTRDEAYEYIVVDYLAAHKGQTLPPAAVLMASRAELQTSAGAGALQQPVYVSVNDQGRVISISADAHRMSPPPAAIDAALEHFRFIPAIDKGVPIAGKARLVVADFVK